MNVEILDNDVFAPLDPENVSRYLKGQNWKQFGLIGEDKDIEIWDYDGPSGSFRVRLPLNRTFLDYDESLGSLVKTVAKARRHSQLEVLDDLSTIAIGDVIRFTAYDSTNRSSTTIPLSEGVSLIEKAKRIATAAALSAEEKKAVFPTYRSPKVSDYLESIRLGQTEKGSYKIKIISPLPVQPNLFKYEVAPFSRLAVITLMDGLDALEKVSKQLIRKGYRFDEFDETVSHGVSANLCEALATAKPRETPTPLDIDVTWSQVIDAPKSSVNGLGFDTSQLAFIRMAAKDFRERNPEVLQLTGYVTACHREKRRSTRDHPRITLSTIVDERICKVHINLPVSDDYDLAVDAHRQERRISIQGELKRTGRFLWLESHQNLELLQDDD